MIQTYLEIAGVVKKAVKEINWIDLDKGQLDDPEAFNSLINKSVLIGQSEIEWSQLAGGYQQGEGFITVKTIFTLPTQTHLTDPLIAKEVVKMFATADQVSAAVLCTPGVLTRTNSKDYPVLTFYVIEQTYMAVFKSGPTFSTKQVSVKINPFLSNPYANA